MFINELQENKNQDLIIQILEALLNVFDVGLNIQAQFNMKKNSYVEHFLSFQGSPALEKLQSSSNEEIKAFVKKLLDEHFDTN